MPQLTSFDGTIIHYYDEGSGPVVILLHGYGLGALTNYGDFEHSRSLIQRNLELFKKEFGMAPAMPAPPEEGRAGLIHELLKAGARVIAVDLRGFGKSGKPLEVTAYNNSAMARDISWLIDKLNVESVDVLGFSMGSLVAAQLLALNIPRLRSVVLSGISEYILEGSVLEFPKSFPVPDHLPRPLTNKAWAEEGARILEEGKIVPGHLASAHVVMAEATGLDPKMLAAVLRGVIAEEVSRTALYKVNVPVLILNGKADVANQKIDGLLTAIPSAIADSCEGDHYSTPFQPSFQNRVISFFQQRWEPVEKVANMNKQQLYLVGDVPGFSPQISKLVSMMNYVRHTTLSALKDITRSELDYLDASCGNSIGSLLLHIAATEIGYQAATLHNRDLNEEEKLEWGAVFVLGDKARKEIKGNDLDFYLNKLEHVRSQTLAKLGSLDDSWLDEEKRFGDNRINNYFKWFHVITHEVNHRGQILMLRRLAKGGD